MVSKVGDCSTKKMKSKKRKAVTESEESSCNDSDKQGYVPCSSFFTKKKIVCFWGKDDLGGNINWYVVNLSIKPKQKLTNKIKKLSAFNHNYLHSHIEKETSIITPVFSFPQKNSPIPLIFNTFATLGSFVYSIGGLYDYPEEKDPDRQNKNSKISGSDLVYYFDTSCKHINYSWKQAPSMISYRQRPQVIAVSGKLYVFGCLGEKKCPHKPRCVWAEFFDPSTGEWDSLTVPKFKECLSVLSPNHTKMKKNAKMILVLADHKRVLKFDIENNCWALIAKFDLEFDDYTRKPPVLVNNIMYWFENNAKAYDILRDETFEGPVQDFSFEQSMRFPPPKLYYSSEEEEEDDYNGRSNDKPATIHLGGRYFCLLAYLPNLEEDNLEEDNPGRIHCLVIKVSKTNQCYMHYCGTRRDIEKFFLRARVVSCQSFPIDRKMEFIDGRIMMI